MRSIVNVGLVNYGDSGNLYSVKRALEKAGAKVIIISDKQDFNIITHLVLPGVGSFKETMNKLKINRRD